jgi:hypothetical protein
LGHKRASAEGKRQCCKIGCAGIDRNMVKACRIGPVKKRVTSFDNADSTLAEGKKFQITIRMWPCFAG